MPPPFRTLVSRHFRSLLKPITSSNFCGSPLHSHFNHPLSQRPSSIFGISFTVSSPSLQIDDRSEPESVFCPQNGEGSRKKKKKEKQKKERRPLDLFFKEAVGLCPKTEEDFENGGEESESQSGGLKQSLRELEMEVGGLKLKEVPEAEAGSTKGKKPATSLYAAFTSSRVPEGNAPGDGEEEIAPKRDDRTVIKELPEDVAAFVRHLYDGGYFNDANFLPNKRFDVCCFENSYGREFVKFAAEKFGKDNQEIAKWLSGSDLKKVALFGCPSTARKCVFSAKRLRFFFGIQEELVCRRCVLNQSCKFMNHNVWKGDALNLSLADVMRVIILYALESTPPQLVYPDEVKASVSKLLREVKSLSETSY